MNSDELLKELLKTGRARCIFDSGVLFLTKGKSYDVWGEYDGGDILVIDDSNIVVPYPLSYFEPINIKSETAENDTKGSFESGFKVGDKVYKYGETDVKTVLEVFEDGYMGISSYPHRVNHEVICHATQENYELLCKPYPHIEFEIPKERTLAEKRYGVIKKLYDSGDIVVVRYDDYESHMIRVGILESLDSLEHPYPYTVVKNWKFAYAVDRKGIEITEDVLNETI